MAPRPHFLGWTQPTLDAAAAWLIDRFADGDRIDLTGVSVVVPGARAGRRLLELLVERVGDRMLVPPRTLTPGRLLERLVERERPAADPLTALLVRALALRDSARPTLEAFISKLPDQRDLPGWLALAEELQTITRQLSTGALRAADVVAAGPGGAADRWRGIDALEQAYAQSLESLDLSDPELGLVDAVRAGRAADPGPIVLVGVVDMPGIVRQALVASGAEADVLIAAPQSEAEAFDEWGQLLVDVWEDRPVPLTDEQLVLADQPRDQAAAVVQAIASACGDQPVHPSDITVAAGDEGLLPAITRALEGAGLHARPATGTPLLESRPASLLRLLARFLRTGKMIDFAALARHADLPELSPDASSSWLTLLDRYIADHLQARVTGDWLGEQGTALASAYHRLQAMLPAGADVARPLAEWAQPIADLLTSIYAPLGLKPHHPQDARVVAALEAIGAQLRGMAALTDGAGAIPPVDLADALAILLRLLAAEAVAPGNEQAAAELVGFLELPMDDAPVAVVAGLNEHAIPASVTSHPLLPDALRQRLGLPENAGRLARDLYALTVIANTRPGTVFIAGRRSAEGDPLLPSRLVLRCDSQTLARRVKDFYAEGAAQLPQPLVTPGVLSGGSHFAIPTPVPPAEPITRLPVTAFRGYLACPYRFYLKWIRGLETLDDDVVEMDGRTFGNIAHWVLDAFASSPIARSDDVDTVEDFLVSELDRQMKRQFGMSPGAAVVLQAEQLSYRLRAFATWQAEQIRKGWQIVPEHTEQSLEAELDVDGEPFLVRGRVDRIDRHPQHGYRVMDYKTSDRPTPPDKAHRDRDGWIDLQLPLYRELVRSVGVTGEVALGYFCLARAAGDIAWQAAEWSGAEIDDAVEEARRIVRAIREGVFWPPSDPAAYEDGFGGICMDRVVDRAAFVVEAGGGEGAADG